MSNECVGWVYRCSPYKGAAFAVHLALADSANDQHGYEVWARQGWVAEKARTTRKTVNHVFAVMAEDGLLELLEKSSGRRGPNRYRFVMDERDPVWTPQPSVTSRDTQVSPTVTVSVTSRDTQVSPTVTQNPIDNPTENPTTKTISRDDAAFAEFYSVYPLKVEPKKARKVWDKIDPVEFPAVLAGAARYRDDPNRVDGFTKYPATWLNAGCWDDDPLPSRTNSNNTWTHKPIEDWWDRSEPSGELEL
jgi:hypothetical protein